MALQEAWDSETEIIVKRAGFPYVARSRNSHRLIGGSGLITLSRFPIVQKEFVPFRTCAGADCLSNKGVLRTRLALPDGSSVDIYNIHMNAWLRFGYDLGSKVRRRQIRTLRRLVRDRSVAAGVRWLVLGDANAPEGSRNYRELREGLQALDAYRELNPNALADPGFTYDRRNPWIPRLPEKHFPSVRIDYIWLAPELGRGLRETRLEFEEPVREGKPLSDHYGLSGRLVLE